jgi:hypothetical protein
MKQIYFHLEIILFILINLLFDADMNFKFLVQEVGMGGLGVDSWKRQLTIKLKIWFWHLIFLFVPISNSKSLR